MPRNNETTTYFHLAHVALCSGGLIAWPEPGAHSKCARGRQEVHEKSANAATRKRKRHEEVAEHIELLVLSDRIGFGGRLPSERELMERFGVGRSTVREALFKLNRMGLVELTAGAPARITQPTAELILNELAGAARHFLARPEGVRHFQHARQLFEEALACEAASRANEEEIGILSEALEANRRSIGDQGRLSRPTSNSILLWRGLPTIRSSLR